MAATLLLLLASAAAARLGELARRDTGDIFTLIGGEECGAAQCAEHGAGQGAEDGGCACVCPQRAPLFREDRELCVDDLPECALATFGTGIGDQRIPFVYLPLKGQIIHPSREITFQDVKTPICAVSGAQFLTRKGFVDLRNTLDADVPFNLFRDEGRTFLQWNGENDIRARMTGRVMVVRLLCRDVAATPNSPLDLRGVFTPCVAFRVQGTPPKYINVSEVQFAPNAHISSTTTTSGLSISEYVAIGISSLLLGLIYVASVFLFLHIRKRRKASSDDRRQLNKKDGLPITERDIIRINNERIHTLPNGMRPDDGIIKKNPLLSRTYTDHKGFISDSSNVSDSEDFCDSSARSDDNLYHNQTTAAIIHQHREYQMKNDSELLHRDESGIERLPDEHVSIVETTDDREITRPVGTTRRKLYFNPAYFEPQLMAEPPPAALEFLTKIREVISIAKHKMAAKRFQPVLNEIPEEETYPSNGNSLDFYQRLGSQKSESVISLKRENSRRKDCVGCPGCQNSSANDILHYVRHPLPSCSNCVGNKGDKQSSIRKWLEDIPPTKQSDSDFVTVPEKIGVDNPMMSLPPLTENRVHKVRKQHSFTASHSTSYRDDFYIPKKSGTMSVKSEPGVRNYNLPLPEFNNINYARFGQTISNNNFKDINGTNGNLHLFTGMQRRIDYVPKNNNVLPDMVNEAVALDHCSKAYNDISSSDDEKLNGNIFDGVTDCRQIPSLSRCSTDIVSGNEYETDSLERNSNKKGILTPTEYPEITSSQASPSLSNALPLEEELTMRNAIYKINSSNSNTPSPHHDISLDKNYYETIEKTKDENKCLQKTITPKTDYSLVSEVYVNNNYNFGSTPTSPSGSECSLGSRKLISNILQEKPGCLTIEVKDPPENYIKIHESDGFEPDTLDRKHTKHKDPGDVQFSRRDFIKSIENIDNDPCRQRIKLRSSGTFVKTDQKVVCTTKFNSLRNSYDPSKLIHERPKLSITSFSGSKSLESTTDETWDEATEWVSDEGRILTLELRHSKRQRQSTPPTIKQVKNLARPDVLPPLPPTVDYPIYEQPTCPPRKVENGRMPMEYSKNENGRSFNPRTFESITPEQMDCDSSTTPESCYGPPCGPMRASVQSQSSDYGNFESRNSDIPESFCRTFTKRRSVNGSSGGLNTDTFVKSDKFDVRTRQKKGTVQDSGYLSSDSTNSTPFQRKLVVAKIVSCSESDDTENEARSESGAESVETHSVFFNCFRQENVDIETTSYNDSSKSSQDDS